MLLVLIRMLLSMKMNVVSGWVMVSMRSVGWMSVVICGLLVKMSFRILDVVVMIVLMVMLNYRF